MSVNIWIRKLQVRNHTGLAAITAVLLAGFTTAGAENSPSDRNFANRWYLGVGPQLSWLKPRTSDTGYKVDDKTSGGGQVYLGFDLLKRLSIEGYYVDQGKAVIGRNADNVRPGGDIDYQQYGISAIGYLYNSRSGDDYNSGFDDEGEYRHEGWSAFGRVGLGGMKNHADPQLNHRRLETTALVLGGGIEYGWANGFAGRAEFTSYDKDSKMLGISILKRFGKPAPYKVVQEVPAAAVAPVTTPTPDVMANLDLVNIQFDLDKSDIKQEGALALDALADKLKSNPDLRLRVDGHACSLGTIAHNQGLSERRANSVVQYLTSKGIDANRFEPQGFGELRPIADNSTEAGRILNRRVEFGILK